MSKLEFLCSAAAISLMSAAVPWSAAAQEVRAPAGATAPGDGGASLEEVVVTARKVTENLQDVPVAVTAISGEGLLRQNAVRISDMASIAPGLTIKPGSSNASAINLQIRGQYQNDVLATLDPSVGTYVDGFYWARAYGLNANLSRK